MLDVLICENLKPQLNAMNITINKVSALWDII